MRYKMKPMLIIPILVTILSMVGGFTWVSATQQSQSAGNPSDNATNTGTTRYLPVLTKNFCTPRPANSPFSIEIAALSEKPLNEMSIAEANDQLDAELQAYPSMLSAMKETCVGWTRVVISWSEIEAVPGSYKNLENWYDVKLGKIAEAGINIIAVINSPPAWARVNSTSKCPPLTEAHIPDFQKFLQLIINRYSKPPYNIHHWELFNEADNATETEGTDLSHACFGKSTALYAQILKTSYPAIKALDPQSTILMSGIAYERWWNEYPDGVFYRLFTDEVMQAGAGNAFDVLNFHYFQNYAAEWERWGPPEQPPTCSSNPQNEGTPYDANGYDVVAKKNFFTNRMNTCYGVSKPVYLTELAAHGYTEDPGSLRFQAYYVIMGYTRGLAAGIKNITWYALFSPKWDPNQQGLLDSSLNPKPSFYAYKTMVNQLTDYQYVRTMMSKNEGDNYEGEAYVFQNSSGKEKIVAWGDNFSLDISPAYSLRLTDFGGNITTVIDGGAGDVDGSQNGTIRVFLPMDPMSDSTIRKISPSPIPFFIEVISK